MSSLAPQCGLSEEQDARGVALPSKQGVAGAETHSVSLMGWLDQSCTALAATSPGVKAAARMAGVGVASVARLRDAIRMPVQP